MPTLPIIRTPSSRCLSTHNHSGTHSYLMEKPKIQSWFLMIEAFQPKTPKKSKTPLSQSPRAYQRSSDLPQKKMKSFFIVGTRALREPPAYGIIKNSVVTSLLTSSEIYFERSTAIPITAQSSKRPYKFTKLPWQLPNFSRFSDKNSVDSRTMWVLKRWKGCSELSSSRKDCIALSCPRSRSSAFFWG